MSFSIDTSEVVALGLALDARGLLANREAGKAVKDAAELTERVAKRDVPRGETGDLAGSINTTGGGLTRYVKAGKHYSVFVEFGTSKMAPQPFMMPAGDKGEEQLVKDLEELVGRAF